MQWPQPIMLGVALVIASAPTPAQGSDARWGSSPPTAEQAPGAPPPVPNIILNATSAAAFDPVATIGAFEAISYRRDGTITDSGDFGEWEHLNRIRFTPGLNCSGHVLATTRVLTDLPLTIEAARWDRNGDSHPGAERGQDWDFGWDVVVNAAIAAADDMGEQPIYFDKTGRAHELGGEPGPVDAVALRGFSVWDKNAWAQALGAMETDHFYLGSLSRVSRRGRMLHHHTVIFVVDGEDVWVQGASPNNPLGPRVESLMATDPDELAALLAQFKNYRSEHIFIIGAPLALERMTGSP